MNKFLDGESGFVVEKVDFSWESGLYEQKVDFYWKGRFLNLESGFFLMAIPTVVHYHFELETLEGPSQSKNNASNAWTGYFWNMIVQSNA